MGVGSVVSCTTDRLDWARQNLAQLDRDDLFSVPVLARIHELAQLDGQAVHGPHLFYVGSAETIHPVRGPADLTIDLVDQDRLPALHAHDGFHHALNYRGDEERPDVLAAVATDADVIVGIAAASADSDDRWQIGLDVQPDYRGRRLGQALTARLAAEILARGKTPYYATRPANIASRNVAVGAGFRPCWIEANTQ
jgi:GNAT superfamily N-acetyltransferase